MTRIVYDIRVKNGEIVRQSASIMTSATPSASVPGESTSAPEEGALGRGHRIAAAMRASMRLSTSNDHTFAKTQYRSCIPSYLEQSGERCWNLATIGQGGKKINGKRFHRHAEWPKVAGAVIKAQDGLDHGIGHLVSMTPPKRSDSASVGVETRKLPRHPSP